MFLGRYVMVLISLSFQEDRMAKQRHYVIHNGEEIRLSQAGIDLKGRGIKDLSEVVGLPDVRPLRRLELQGNEITDIKLMEKFTQLEVLQLGKNKISEIRGLDNLINLQDLGLHDNLITEIKVLDHLENLKYLGISGNPITDLKALENLKNLKELWLSRDDIVSLEEINKLKEKLPDLKVFPYDFMDAFDY
jgi:Leucine-rich repeat (LRR) protein